MSAFPESPIDGALAEVANTDGSAVQYKYDKEQAAWKIVGKTGEIDTRYITTMDVVTTAEEPSYPAEWEGLRALPDIQYLTNQKLVNWTLADAVIALQDADYTTIYYSPTAPVGEHTFEFWFNTNDEELLIWYEDKWFPISVPPSQINVITEIIEGLEVSVTQVKADIAKNKSDIDANTALITNLNGSTIAYKDQPNIFVAENKFKVGGDIGPLIIESSSAQQRLFECKGYVNNPGLGNRKEVFTVSAHGNVAAQGSITSGSQVIVPVVPKENTHACNKFYTDALDTVVHGMIDVIIGRKVYAKFRLQKDDRTLRSGSFKLLTVPQSDSDASQANDWEDVNYVYFDSRDYDGNRRAMTELKVGMQLSMETPRGAATFIIIETGVNNSDYMFRLDKVSFLGDPEDDLVYQMVAGEEGKLTAEEVGDIVLNRFNATDAIRNSYGKYFQIDRFYDPGTNIRDGRFHWDSINDTIYLSKKDMNNFQWSNNSAAGDLPGPCFFSIYDPAISGGAIGSVKLRGTFERFEANSKFCALSKVKRVASSTLLDGNYLINLGGFM